MFVKLFFTPMLSVMVWPSLNPRSSFGPESPSCAFLLISFSCFTHLRRRRDQLKINNYFLQASYRK